MQDGIMFTFGFIIIAVYTYFMLTTKWQQEKIERESHLDQAKEQVKDTKTS